LRAPDGPDERLPDRRGDRVRPDQPGVVVPGLVPGQGGRLLRRRRLGPGPRLRPRRARRAGAGVPHPGVTPTLRFAAATRAWIRGALICCARNRKWTPEQTGPESAARARYTRARSPPGVPARSG